VSFARELSSERNGRASYEAVSLFIAGESLAALVPERWRKFPIAVRTAAGASPAWRRGVVTTSIHIPRSNPHRLETDGMVSLRQGRLRLGEAGIAAYKACISASRGLALVRALYEAQFIRPLLLAFTPSMRQAHVCLNFRQDWSPGLPSFVWLS
jgi:hypothetical protein